MIESLLNLPCLVVNRSFVTRDEMGNDTPTESTTETVCEIQQKQRDEESDELASAVFLAMFPAGTVVASADAVIADGVEYEVRGEPWPVRNPRTQTVSHVEATVVRVAGVSEVGS